MNKVILIGWVGDNPKIYDRKCKVANFSLATNEYAGKEKYTEWHSVVAFGKVADVLQNYVKKGDQIYVEGRIKKEKWEDENGGEKVFFKIICHQVELLGSKNSVSKEKKAAKNIKNEQSGKKENTQQQDMVKDLPMDDYDDELPF